MLESLFAILPLMLALGAATGLLAGLLGVGGGIVIVPVLIEFNRRIGMSMSDAAFTAIGTAQATMVIASLMAARAHSRGFGIDRPILAAWAAPVLVGAAAGLLIARLVPTPVLILAFVAVALLLSVQMLLRGRIVLRQGLPSGFGAMGLPFALGGLSSALGVGAGTLGVPALTLFGVPLQRSLGAASVLAALVAGVATLGFVALGWRHPGLPADAIGYVEVGGAAIMSAAALLAAPFGARLARRAPVWLLQMLFVVVLWAVSARMLWVAFAG